MSFLKYKLIKSNPENNMNPPMRSTSRSNFLNENNQFSFHSKININPEKTTHYFNKTNKNSFNSTVAEGSSSISSSSSLRVYEVQHRKNKSDSERQTILLKKILVKASKVDLNQLKRKKEIAREKELANKRFELRELRRKVSKITDNDSFKLCDSFIRNNDIYNSKFLSDLKSKKYFDRYKEYHRNFHYHINDLSEAHDKYAMIIDIDKLNQGALQPSRILKRNLSDAEIQIIKQDPSYFIKKALYLKNVKGLQKVTLLEKLSEEETNQKEVYLSDNEVEKKEICKANRIRDVRFNWTLFDTKIDDALHKVKKKLNQLKTNKELNNETTNPEVLNKLRNEIDDTFRKALIKKCASTFNLDFTKRLPRKQLKSYLNQEVGLRLRHEADFFKNRETLFARKNNDDYLNQLQLRKIKDNLINNKKILIYQL